MSKTATEPGTGIVHKLDGGMTKCGKDASGWSREVTALQALGLVAECKECNAATQDPRRR